MIWKFEIMKVSNGFATKYMNYDLNMKDILKLAHEKKFFWKKYF